MKKNLRKMQNRRKDVRSMYHMEEEASCFGSGKVDDLHRVQGILNQHGYHSILQRHGILGAKLTLQQGNDLKHTSKLHSFMSSFVIGFISLLLK